MTQTQTSTAPMLTSERNRDAFVGICNIFNTGDLSGVDALIARNDLEHDLPPAMCSRRYTTSATM